MKLKNKNFLFPEKAMKRKWQRREPESPKNETKSTGISRHKFQKLKYDISFESVRRYFVVIRQYPIRSSFAVPLDEKKNKNIRMYNSSSPSVFAKAGTQITT